MKNRGGATALTTVAVAVIVAMAGLGYYLWPEGGPEGLWPGGAPSLPKYPGAQVVPSGTTSQLPTGWSAEVYSTSDSVSDVMSWYRTQMSGWETVQDTTMSLGGITYYILACANGDDAAAIVAAEAEGLTAIVLAAGPREGLTDMLDMLATVS